MPSLEKKTALGITGEKIVRNFMTEKGFIITDTINVYDSDMDFEATKKNKKYTVEVKTQVPFILKKSFSIRENQLRKCRSVDMLFFVSVPSDTPTPYDGQIYRIDMKAAKTEKYVTKDGRNMILIPIEQPAMREMKKLSDEHIQLLIANRSSNY